MLEPDEIYKADWHSPDRQMDIDIDSKDPVTKKEIIYLAGKICNGHEIDLNYNNRFAQSVMKSP